MVNYHIEWSNQANKDMETIKSQTNATAKQMGQLMSQIANWAKSHDGPSPVFDFGKFRDHGVRAQTSRGVIKSVTYGDRP